MELRPLPDQRLLGEPALRRACRYPPAAGARRWSGNAALLDRGARRRHERAGRARRESRAQGAPDRAPGDAGRGMTGPTRSSRDRSEAGIRLETHVPSVAPPDMATRMTHALTERPFAADPLAERFANAGVGGREVACSVGIMAYNEEANIAQAIATILEQRVSCGHIAEL